MTPEELKKKIEATQTVTPDAFDRMMLTQAKRINDGSTVPLDKLMRGFEQKQVMNVRLASKM